MKSGTVLAAAIFTGAVIAAGACGGGGRSPAASPGPAETATTAGAASPDTSPPRPTPTSGASPTATPPTGAVRELREGEAVTVGRDLVLYYHVGCYACDGGQPDIYRAYVDPVSGALVRESLFAGVTARYGGEIVSFSADWDRGEMVIGVCLRGYCSRYGNGPRDGQVQVLRSTDGGVTWPELVELPATTFLMYAAESGLVAATGDPVNGYTYRTFPAGAELTPPGGPRTTFPETIDGLGFVWVQDGFDYGGVVAEAGVPRARLRARERWSGDLYFAYDLDGRQAIRAVGPGGGRAFGDWKWPGGLIDVRGVFGAGPLVPPPTTSARRLYGTADLGGGTCGDSGCAGDERMFRVETVLIDLDTATVHPLPELSAGLTGNQNPWAERFVTGRFAVVAGAGDCLNVRQGPSTNTPVLGCFADGVLLTTAGETAAAEGRTWLAVRTPSGQPGYAAAEFLRY